MFDPGFFARALRFIWIAVRQPSRMDGMVEKAVSRSESLHKTIDIHVVGLTFDVWSVTRYQALLCLMFDPGLFTRYQKFELKFPLLFWASATYTSSERSVLYSMISWPLQTTSSSVRYIRRTINAEDNSKSLNIVACTLLIASITRTYLTVLGAGICSLFG